jgi:ADP-heptose:LPS heptosyltransferase
MAVALGKPVFPILGPTSRRKVFPDFLSNVSIISENFDCQPCQENKKSGVWREDKSQCFCPYSIRCMNHLSVNKVLNHISEKLKRDIRL